MGNTANCSEYIYSEKVTELSIKSYYFTDSAELSNESY